MNPYTNSELLHLVHILLTCSLLMLCHVLSV